MTMEEMAATMKGKSREERTAYFNSHKAELGLNQLSAVNGGAGSSLGNPGSSVPDRRGNYWTSMGFVCEGRQQC